MESKNIDHHFLALRLTVDKAGIFLNQIMNLSLTDQQVADLCKRTEGWIAGIHLSALSLTGCNDASNVQHFIDTFTDVNTSRGLLPIGQEPVEIEEGPARAELRRGATQEGSAVMGQGLVAVEEQLVVMGRGLVTTGQGPGLSLRMSEHELPLIEMLSEREYSVLRLVSEGLSNQEIARHLVVTVSTIKTHLNNIYAKFQVHTRLQAVTKAYDLGLLSPWTGASPKSCETEDVPLN